MFFQNFVYSLFQATHANLHERECCRAVARLFHTYRSNFLGKKNIFYEIPETKEEFFIILELICGLVISFDVLKVFDFNLCT